MNDTSWPTKRPLGAAFGALGLSLLCSGQALAGPVTFTGNVAADFVGPDVVTSLDPGIIDVGIPIAFPLGTISGWDMADVRFSYDPLTDILYVGINTYGIAGDADGDGNPNGTGPILAGLGGTDFANLGNSESIDVYFDIDQDGTMDIIAGVAAGVDATGFKVAQWNPFASVYTPSFAYGTPLPANTGTFSGAPSAGSPDFEFTIQHWSTLPTSSGSDSGPGVGFTAFLGSFSDAGIGEDFNPGAGSTTDITVGRCGDARVGAGEQCDDGNLINTDGCRNDCQLPVCGDGVVQQGEECDDGNNLWQDACAPTCEDAGCTDTQGYWRTHNRFAPSPRTTSWPIDEATMLCGHSWLSILETPAGDAWATLAQKSIAARLNAANGASTTTAAADAISSSIALLADCSISGGELASAVAAGNTLDAFTNGSDGPLACDASCGDGRVDAGETCDDANNSDNDSCLNTCLPSRCGDGVLQAGVESCDDGNLSNNDGCTNTCTVAACGDGYVQGAEACDDGNTINTDACSNTCRVATCGDGIQQAGEQCDDGNTVNTDACTSTCTTARCGDHIVRAGVEQCDDGNAFNTDSCTNTCTTATCGDGYMQAGETCDDGNRVAGDGCGPTCAPEHVCANNDVPGLYPVTNNPSGWGLYFTALFGGGDVRMVINPGASYNVNWATGTATFSGTAYEYGNASKTWTFSYTYQYRGLGSSFAGTQGVFYGVYTPNPTELAQWTFWNLTSGRLTRNDGKYIDVYEVAPFNSKSTQIGRGANLWDANWGLGNWLAYTARQSNGTVINTNIGDVNADIGFVPPPCVCGDGVVDAGEVCDDHNTIPTDSCTATCDLPSCGDGIVWGGHESCDDGNTSNNDSCTNSCSVPRCGDGYQQPGEVCDDGNLSNADGCTNTCALPRCGDGYQQGGEMCDDGNASNTDGCTTTCLIARCGDGFQQPGEQCDDGNTVDTDACTTVCELARCGDGVRQGLESCDDGNTNNADGCTNTCALPRCGDGYVQAGETCDDGNTNNADACSNTCHTATCGDAIVQAGEQCDDGNAVNTDACTTTCRTAVCGDGYAQPGEACDDGNLVNTDTCTTTCTTAACGDGYLQAGEACDDHNLVAGDGCDTTCGIEEPCEDATIQHTYNVSNLNGQRVFWLPNLYGSGLTELAVEAGSSYVVDWELGKGRFSGTAHEMYSPSRVWTFDVIYTYRGAGSAGQGSAGPMFGSYHPSATELGDWLYWDMTSATATRNDNGYELVMVQYPTDDSKPMQMGRGANFFDSNWGFANWLTWDLYDAGGNFLYHGSGDINAVVDHVGAPCDCGDGHVDVGESCDDGNANESDSCTSQCAPPACGDGILSGTEACDDGNNANNDACTNACTVAVCGDGFRQPGEQCDDGNASNTDGCTTSCNTASCGDGYTQPGEQCDDANGDNTDGCTTACALPTCGDGFVQAGEACDDGNTTNTDSCTNVCEGPTCGDGYVQAGESCDDGNTVNTDGCRNDCGTAACGDGFVQPGEECDDGNANTNDACTVYCLNAVCGDSIVGPGEACDDGDHDNNDGCTDTCQPTQTCEDLGVAQDYNLFVFGNYEGGHDVGGKVAVGGDILMNEYAINYASPGGQALVVGGTMNLDTGNVWGDGFYGTAQNVVNTSFVGGDLYNSMPINFAFYDAKLNELCTDLDALPTNGSANVQLFGSSAIVTLTGTDTAVNVFTLDAATVDAMASFTVNVPAGSTTIVQLDGGPLSFTNFGFNYNGADANHVLFVTCDAVAIDLYSVGFKGSLLAPNADVSFNNSSFDGTLVAQNVAGNGEFHAFPFQGDLPCPTCGNGAIEAPETCDDGGLASGDGCSAVCSTEGCGDGFIQAGESCDDHNTVSGDGCSATCVDENPPTCGDGYVDAGEDCDDGNVADDDGCSAVCDIEFCGDGVTQTGETCDDGNAYTGDGCSSACAIENSLCGNGVIDAGEGCDDGCNHDGDGCSASCQVEPAYCGDGVIDAGEACDDGNDTAGDGCNACVAENCAADLGLAGGFNVFVRTAYVDGHDVAGRVAAGELVRMDGFAVAVATPASPVEYAPVLVSGGALELRSGTIWGNATYGLSLLTAPGTVGFPNGHGFVNASPIAFDAASDNAAKHSFNWHALSANGSATLQYGLLELVGSDAATNIIDLDSLDLSKAHTIAITAPAGSKVVVNVRGSSAQFMNAGMVLSGVNPEDVLFNFPEATSVEMGGVGFQGSILAPYADVTFYNGQIRGQIISWSLTGNVELYWNAFTGTVDCASWNAFKAAQIAAGTWGSTF